MTNIKPFDIDCIILSGGKSSRMGEDKSLLPFKDKNSLIEYQYSRLKPYFNNVYISTKNDKFDFSANLIFDSIKDESSPMIALKTIFETLNLEKAFIITVDTPLVKIETISELIMKSKGFDITFPETKKEHYLCGVYYKSCLSLINDSISNNIHKIGYLIKNSKTQKITFLDDNEFININTKDEYKRAFTLIS